MLCEPALTVTKRLKGVFTQRILTRNWPQIPLHSDCIPRPIHFNSHSELHHGVEKREVTCHCFDADSVSDSRDADSLH